MILNPSDPSGLGLFSRCARNQASRMKPHRPTTAARSKTVQSSGSLHRKKMVTHYGFERQESREQRQSKFNKNDAPPVGHYNPLKKDKPKLVWDILKIYHRQVARKKQSPPPKEIPTPISTPTPELIPPPEDQQEEIVGEAEPQPSVKVIPKEKQRRATSPSRNQCIVNMSRMTGRKQKVREGSDWGDSDIMNSLAYTKRSTSKNIYFAKQPKEPSKRYKTINAASNYSYDYSVVKPRKGGVLNFSHLKGRDWYLKTENEYSYQHYEYNDYVWQSSSRIYPNTKTHLLEFSKQTNRSRIEMTSQLSHS